MVLHSDSAGVAACARCTDSSFCTDGSLPDASALGADAWDGPSAPVQLLCLIQHQVQPSDGRWAVRRLFFSLVEI